MRNHFLLHFEKIIMLKIKGKSIDRYLSYLYRSKINILGVYPVDRNEVKIKVYERDYNKIMEIKSSNEIEIIDYHGILKFEKIIRQYKYLFISIILGYIVLLFLTNIIFNVQVIHNDRDIRNLVIKELVRYNIKKYQLKKDYDELEKIENKILNDYKDKIEWIEIEEVGTKYIVKVEERKLTKNKEEYKYQDIVAAKEAVIIKIEALSGVIVKKVNDYVQKGDVLISGLVYNGDKLTDMIKADGKIWGEVWYNVKVEFPLIHNSSKKTGKTKYVYSIIFLNNKLSLFDFKPFKDKSSDMNTIIYNRLLPFKVIKEKQFELKVKDEIYSEGEALIKAEQLAEKKMKACLDEDEKIISKRTLKYYSENDKIYLDMFYKVYENIAEAREINLEEYNQS